MLRNRLAALTAAAIVGTVLLGIAGCSGGATTPAPTPVQSSDLTSSDGGFDEQAAIGVVLAPGDAGSASGSGSGSRKTGTPVAPGDVETPSQALDARFRAALTDAGYTPEVRVADASTPLASQQRAIHDVVRAGAKVVLVQAVDPDGITAQVRYAHDAGAIVVAVGTAIPGTGEKRTGADYRLADGPSVSDATLVSDALDVIDDLQRGKRPSGV